MSLKSKAFLNRFVVKLVLFLIMETFKMPLISGRNLDLLNMQPKLLRCIFFSNKMWLTIILLQIKNIEHLYYMSM